MLNRLLNTAINIARSMRSKEDSVTAGRGQFVVIAKLVYKTDSNPKTPRIAITKNLPMSRKHFLKGIPDIVAGPALHTTVIGTAANLLAGSVAPAADTTSN
jgi:hypothetical protein